VTTGPLFRVEGLSIGLVGSQGVRRVVDDVSFGISVGESLAFVGESGSGKSLIAMGALDLLTPGARVLEGRTTFLGEELQTLDKDAWRRLVGVGIGVLFQDALGSWDPTYLIGSQSGEVLHEHEELTDEEIQRRVLDALGEVRLSKRAKYLSFSHEMSRGEAQRAMLAAALLSGPRLLIADEPLSGLDVTVARALLNLMDDMRSKRGMGLIFVTHDFGVVASIADRVAVVYGGMIVEEASAPALYRHPRHPYTAGLLRSVPAFAGDRLEPIPGEPPDLRELPPGCPFVDRCAHAIKACAAARPDPRPVGDSLVACIRAGELELAGIAG
jgi:oligopeptide/dipeptide ABC transporter ATP-binding protein